MARRSSCEPAPINNEVHTMPTPDYDSGYDIGHSDGFTEGYDSGYQAGFEENPNLFTDEEIKARKTEDIERQDKAWKKGDGRYFREMVKGKIQSSVSDFQLSNHKMFMWVRFEDGSCLKVRFSEISYGMDKMVKEPLNKWPN